MKTTSTLFILVALGLFADGIYAGVSVNWDVPSAMITSHQTFDAFLAFVVPAVVALGFGWAGLMCFVYAEDTKVKSYRRTK